MRATKREYYLNIAKAVAQRFRPACGGSTVR